jgi:thioredoxin reductase (NADPH)
LKKKKILTSPEYEVVAFQGEDRIKGIVVSTKGGEKREIPIDGVFMAVGWGPNLEMLEIPVETTPEGYIKTDKIYSSFPGLLQRGCGTRIFDR